MKKILITGGSGFIGTYLIDTLLKEGECEILNIDIANPKEDRHLAFWEEVNILDKETLLNKFKMFQPTQVVHLAARTDTDPKNVLEDYKTNTVGTANVLEGIKECDSVQRVVITSTQFVHQYKGLPLHDQDYAPHTVYGESKIITEQLTRKANLECCWTLIRPTNIWGPRHPRYPSEFWYVLKKGRYFHPGGRAVIRSYGYVGNVVDQINTILKKDKEVVNGQVFYVGDEPINLYDWVNGFSLALNNQSVKKVPRILVKGLALIGDGLRVCNIRFPITTSRYKSMTNSNTAPMEKTIKVLGNQKYSLDAGILETVQWLKDQDKFWIN